MNNTGDAVNAMSAWAKLLPGSPKAIVKTSFNRGH